MCVDIAVLLTEVEFRIKPIVFNLPIKKIYIPVFPKKNIVPCDTVRSPVVCKYVRPSVCWVQRMPCDRPSVLYNNTPNSPALSMLD